MLAVDVPVSIRLVEHDVAVEGGRGTEITTLPGGEKYTGEFRSGEFHGQGIYTYANGDQHIGEYQNGQSHGQGTYRFAGGDKYIADVFGDGVYILAGAVPHDFFKNFLAGILFQAGLCQRFFK